MAKRSGYVKRRVYMVESVNAEHLLMLLGGPYALLLLHIIKRLDRNINRYYSNKENRADIQRKLDIPEVTYQRQLKWLVKKRILVKHERGIYSLNRNIINVE